MGSLRLIDMAVTARTAPVHRHRIVADRRNRKCVKRVVVGQHEPVAVHRRRPEDRHDAVDIHVM